MFDKVKNFLREISLEFKRITWPERKELTDSTTVVIVFIVLIAFTIMVCDEVIRSALAFILT